MARNSVDVISSKWCSRVFLETNQFSLSRIGLNKMMMTSADYSDQLVGPVVRESGLPFSGLVICVTGLSKEARNQVMEATERLGGEYSGSLHPKCTHLVVQSFGGRKYEHALKHGVKNGLHVVTLGWFVDSAKKNVRLNESLYSVKYIGDKGTTLVELNELLVPNTNEISCLPNKGIENNRPFFYNKSFYIDPDISSETKKKIIDAVNKEGAKLLDHWFISSNANYLVCEGPSIQKYIVHSNNLVTPLWVLKTIKEKSFPRLVHISSDLAKHISIVLENTKFSNEDNENRTSISGFNLSMEKLSLTNEKIKGNLEDRKKIAELAKQGVRDRRSRRMHATLQPITPSSLLDTICWSVSDHCTLACVYTDSALSEDQQNTPPILNQNEDDNKGSGLDSLSRPLKESEKREVVFKNHLITILFPIDRFGEMGPTSRTFFSTDGFTCIQLLDHIYNFYQENMSNHEIEVAIHTDSRHADRLRSLYFNHESIKQGFVSFKRIDFLGSRRSFESLKRLSGDTNCNVYELLVRA